MKQKQQFWFLLMYELPEGECIYRFEPMRKKHAGVMKKNGWAILDGPTEIEGDIEVA